MPVPNAGRLRDRALVLRPVRVQDAHLLPHRQEGQRRGVGVHHCQHGGDDRPPVPPSRRDHGGAVGEAGVDPGVQERRFITLTLTLTLTHNPIPYPLSPNPLTRIPNPLTRIPNPLTLIPNPNP